MSVFCQAVVYLFLALPAAAQSQGFATMRLPPPPPNTTPAGNPFSGLPTIFTVLDRLGLELKRQEDILPVYTVERIERPTAN
jgi:hypothetical protein